MNSWLDGSQEAKILQSDQEDRSQLEGANEIRGKWGLSPHHTLAHTVRPAAMPKKMIIL